MDGLYFIAKSARLDRGRAAQKKKRGFSASRVSAVKFAGVVVYNVDVGNARIVPHSVDCDQICGPQAIQRIVFSAVRVVNVKCNHFGISFPFVIIV